MSVAVFGAKESSPEPALEVHLFAELRACHSLAIRSTIAPPPPQ